MIELGKAHSDQTFEAEAIFSTIREPVAVMAKHVLIEESARYVLYDFGVP